MQELTAFMDALPLDAIGSHFIVIGGIEMEVEDILRLLRGERFLPKLSTREINEELLFQFGPETDARATVLDDMITWVRHQIGLKKIIQNRRKTKFVEMRGMARGFLGKGGIKLPNRDAVLSALTGHQLRFSSLAEFLSRFAELTPEDGRHVLEAIQEIKGTDLLETRYVTRSTSAPIHDSLEETKRALVCEILGMAEKDLEHIPLIVLERAAFGEKMTKEEFQAIASYCLSKLPRKDLPYTVQELSMFFAALGFVPLLTIGTWGTADIQFLYAMGFAGLTSTPLLGLRPNKYIEIWQQRWSDRKFYERAFTRLSAATEKLGKTHFGRLKQARLKGAIKESHEDLRVEEKARILSENVQLEILINELACSDEETSAFEAFAATHLHSFDLSTGSGAIKAIEEFKRFKAAEYETGAEQLLAEQRRATHSLADVKTH